MEIQELVEMSAGEFKEFLNEVKQLRRKKRKKVAFVSHREELKAMSISPRKAIRIIAQYSIEKNITFYSKEQVSEFISRNIKAATILQGLPGERILRTIEYLKKNADFKWTLETVVKYAEDIDNLSPKKKQGLGEFLVK